MKAKTMTEIGKDNIPLVKGKQSALSKAVKKIKKGKGKGPPKNDLEDVRGGIIMLKHIPHGFYEKEIKDYFSQFGKVKRVRVARSLKTGKSRGYAYVEFFFEEVAKIAAEAMNNYLMFERLIKCEVMPASVNKRKLFKNSWVREHKNPKIIGRKKTMAERDQELTEEEEKGILRQRLDKLEQQKKRLAEMGIDFTLPSIVAAPAIKSVKPTTPKVLKNAEIKRKVEHLDEGDSDNESSSYEEEIPLLFKSPKMKEKLFKTSEIKQKVEHLDDGSSEDESSSYEEDIPLLFKSPKMKEKPVSPANKFSPKLLRGRKSQAQQTPTTVSKTEKKAKSQGKADKTDLPRISPKMLRSRKSQGPQTATPVNNKTEKKTKAPGKADKPDLPRISPKMLRSRKSQGPQTATPVSNKTEKKAKTPGKTDKTDLPRISPKMLRSRKSDATGLTPMKGTTSAPGRNKKAGRKSVF